MKRLLFGLIFISSISYGQQKDTLTIYQCYDLAIKAHPIQNNYLLAEEIGNLKAEKALTYHLPVLNFNARASYQSDVIDLEQIFSAFPPNIPAPEIEAFPKDQYNIFAEASQLIYDGGLIKGLEKLEKESARAEMQKVKIEVYGIREQINNNYFGILLIQEQMKIILLFIDEMNKRIEVLKVAFDNGIINQSNIYNLKSELLLVNQKLIELEYSKKTLVYSLSRHIGIEKISSTYIVKPNDIEIRNDKISRLEIDLFSIEKSKLDLNAELAGKKRYPVITGFAQAGYGRPGLNMLDPNFSEYYLVGVNLKWNIWDWGRTNKDLQTITLSKNLINNKEENFIKNIDILAQMELVKIYKYTELLKNDEEFIKLKEQIAENASTELENGTMTSTDYISELNAAFKAKLNKEVHLIELSKSQINLKTILGKL